MRMYLKAISCLVFQAAKQLRMIQPETEARSVIEVNELCNFSMKNVQMLDLVSDGFHFCQSTWFCLYQHVDQDSLRAFEATEGR